MKIYLTGWRKLKTVGFSRMHNGKRARLVSFDARVEGSTNLTSRGQMDETLAAVISDSRAFRDGADKPGAEK